MWDVGCGTCSWVWALVLAISSRSSAVIKSGPCSKECEGDARPGDTLAAAGVPTGTWGGSWARGLMSFVRGPVSDTLLELTVMVPGRACEPSLDDSPCRLNDWPDGPLCLDLGVQVGQGQR